MKDFRKSGLAQLSELPPDVYTVFPDHERPISRSVVPGNGRRCQTCPPWSVNDIGRRFNLRLGPDGLPPPRFYVDASILQPYQDVRVMLDWHDSLVLLLDRKYVMKMMSPLFDPNTIVANMERAREVVPVPVIHKHGRSGNCVFIIMDYIEGWQASTLVRYFGPWVEVKLQDQIDEVIAQLSRVGLSHNDLYPRNVFLGDDWKITGIIDWDYAAPLWASTEYERRSTLNLREKTWHYLFLKHSVDRVGTLGANPSDGGFKYYHKPAPGRILTKDPPYKWALPDSWMADRELMKTNPGFRIVVLHSGPVKLVQHLVVSAPREVSPHASVALIISDTDHNDAFANMCEHCNSRYVSILPTSCRYAEFRRQVLTQIVRAKPDIILLSNWQHNFGADLWRATLIPRTLSDFASFPAVLGIRPSLAGHWNDLPDPIFAAYEALRLGFGARETGITAFRVFPYREVEWCSTHLTIGHAESFSAFQYRMHATLQEFTAHVLRQLMTRVERYTGTQRLMDGTYYGINGAPSAWNKRHPISELFLYLELR